MLHAYGLLKTCCFQITPIIWGWGWADISINITDLIFFQFPNDSVQVLHFLDTYPIQPFEAGEFYFWLRGK